jgi:hypothetical protein
VKHRRYSALMLALAGALLMALGLYFVFVRPPLLPEDLRFMGASLAAIEAAVPGLPIWLRRVFWVLGGYMFTTGLLTLYVANTSFRTRDSGVAALVALAGLTSIGWMGLVNIMIDSDYKWLILAFALPWAIALALFWLEPERTSPATSAPRRST